MNEINNQINNKDWFIFGDFNFNLLENNQLNTNYLNLMCENNMFICDQKTVTRNCSNSCLDHIFTNNINQDLHLHYVETDISDHSLIIIEIKKKKTNTYSNSPGKFYNNFKHTDFNKLNNELVVNPIIINNCNTVDSMYDSFIENFKNKINLCTKVKQNKLTNKSNKPWVNSDLNMCIRSKSFWYSKLCKDKNNLQLKTEYCFWRNKYSRLKNSLKKKYFKNNFEKNKESVKNTWNCIYQVLYDGQPPKKKLKLLDGNADKSLVTNKLNDYFCEVGRSLALSHNPRISIIPAVSTTHFQFRLTNCNEIVYIIKKLKNSNSIGPDGLSVKFFKNCSDNIFECINSIINKSLVDGIVPRNLKISKTVPIFKSGDTQDFNNYRPISLLPITEKILETVVMNQLNDFLINENKLSPNQYGFRKQSGTSTALFDIISEIQKARDHGMYVACIFIDLKKAFDAIDRSILMKKLFSIGIRGTAFNWFKSYLNDRQQYTQAGDYTSNLKNIDFGVPQGSKSGPTLFNIYIDSLNTINLCGKLFLYADDIVLVYASKNPLSLESLINRDLDNVSVWTNNNRLTVNTTKTKYMLFGTSEDFSLNIQYCGNIIELVTEFKYLGVIIDRKMKFDNHITSLGKKLSKTAGIFRRISRYVPVQIKRSIYFSLFASHVQYGLITWGSTFKTKIKPLQRLQNKAIRNLFIEDPYSHAIDIHTKHNILSINLSTQLYQSIHIHAILADGIHSNTLLEPGQQFHNTRNAVSIRTNNIHSTTFGQNSAQFSASKSYNNLPEELKQLNHQKFISEIKNYTHNILNSMSEI